MVCCLPNWILRIAFLFFSLIYTGYDLKKTDKWTLYQENIHKCVVLSLQSSSFVLSWLVYVSSPSGGVILSAKGGIGEAWLVITRSIIRFNLVLNSTKKGLCLTLRKANQKKWKTFSWMLSTRFLFFFRGKKVLGCGHARGGLRNYPSCNTDQGV